MSDRGSVRSGYSRGYRRVSRGCEVDETLFASNHKDSVSRLRAQREKSKVRGIGRPEKETKKEVVISKRQLDLIKNRARLVSNSEIEEKKREEDEQKKIKMARAQARKARMIELENERKKKKVLTLEEEEDEVKLNETLARAADMRLENLDQVKTMRRKMMYAQCAKIREAQIEEKRQRANEQKAFEERQDILMEVSRLKNLKRAEGEKKKRVEQQHKDAQEIRVQIEERKRQRILEDELLEQEKQQMKAMIKQQEEEAVKKRQDHALASKKLLSEVLQANEEAITQKHVRKQEEKEEDERILRWQEEKRLQEEALEAEKRALKKQKDQEFYELASQMKRSMDNRAEQDALRAKRHQQEQERKERQRERALVEKQRKQLEDLKIAREEQQRRKIENLKLLALADKEEWTKINRENANIQAQIDKIHAKRLEINAQHQLELCEQIKAREFEKEERNQKKREEGERLKLENARFLKKIQKKKEEILEQMRNGDIPEKFCAEVALMQVNLQ